MNRRIDLARSRKISPLWTIVLAALIIFVSAWILQWISNLALA